MTIDNHSPERDTPQKRSGFFLRSRSPARVEEAFVDLLRTLERCGFVDREDLALFHHQPSRNADVAPRGRSLSVH
jgi:hypothetical protein